MISHRRIAIALFLALSSASAAAQAASDGTIEFTGNINATTCKVQGSAPGQGNVNVPVDLGSVSVANLAAAGERAGTKGFNITIGGAGDAGCTNGGTARVRFDPTSPAIDPVTGRLRIDTSGTPATNVEIEIANADGTPIHLFTDTSTSVTIENNQAVIPLVGRYYATAAAGAGDANSRVAFMIAYD